jgi:anti-sigma regulatory factor (Ser/Thr protein kinase)
MHSDWQRSGREAGFVHQAMVYGSEAEFMEVATPFVEEGLSSKQPTLVAVQRRHIENLRAALGGTPDGVTLYEVEEWYVTSAGTREKFARWAAERTGAGGRARLMGEPPWAIGHEAQVRDWARHESVINLAFAGQPVTFICPYDARALPDEVLGHAHDTHPEIVDGSGVSASSSFENPIDFCTRLDSAVEPQDGEPFLQIEFGLDDLPVVRRAVGSFALDSGLGESQSDELVLAVNEITTNAVVHGRPPSILRAWPLDGEVVVEVTDAGDGIRDVLAGQLTPSTISLGGRGLRLARLLCDAVEVRNVAGCAVTMHLATTNGDRSLTAA